MDGPGFRSNDEVTLILDTGDATISVQKNDGNEQCIFKNITKSDDVQYKLCIDLFSIDNSITWTNFDCT